MLLLSLGMLAFRGSGVLYNIPRNPSLCDIMLEHFVARAWAP